MARSKKTDEPVDRGPGPESQEVLVLVDDPPEMSEALSALYPPADDGEAS